MKNLPNNRDLLWQIFLGVLPYKSKEDWNKTISEERISYHETKKKLYTKEIEEFIKNNGDEICSNYRNRALNLNYYRHIIEQLFLDIKEVASVDYNKIDEIKMLMEDYSFDKLKKIFNFLN